MKFRNAVVRVPWALNFPYFIGKTFDPRAFDLHYIQKKRKVPIHFTKLYMYISHEHKITKFEMKARSSVGETLFSHSFSESRIYFRWNTHFIHAKYMLSQHIQQHSTKVHIFQDNNINAVWSLQRTVPTDRL